MSLLRNAGAVTASFLLRNNDDVQPIWYSVLTRLEPEDTRWPRSVTRAQATPNNDWFCNAPLIWEFTTYNYNAGFGGQRYIVSGITLDANGALLGNSFVTLYETATDNVVDTGVFSDPTTAVYIATSPFTTASYAVAYKTGTPDVFGTTVNTLTPG